MDDLLQPFLFHFQLLDFLFENIVLVVEGLPVDFALHCLQLRLRGKLSEPQSALGNVVVFLVRGNAENEFHCVVPSHGFLKQFRQRTVSELDESVLVVLLHFQYHFGEEEKAFVYLLGFVLFSNLTLSRYSASHSAYRTASLSIYACIYIDAAILCFVHPLVSRQVHENRSADFLCLRSPFDLLSLAYNHRQKHVGSRALVIETRLGVLSVALSSRHYLFELKEIPKGRNCVVFDEEIPSAFLFENPQTVFHLLSILQQVENGLVVDLYVLAVEEHFLSDHSALHKKVFDEQLYQTIPRLSSYHRMGLSRTSLAIREYVHRNASQKTGNLCLKDFSIESLGLGTVAEHLVKGEHRVRVRVHHFLALGVHDPRRLALQRLEPQVNLNIILFLHYKFLSKSIALCTASWTSSNMKTLSLESLSIWLPSLALFPLILTTMGFSMFCFLT